MSIETHPDAAGLAEVIRNTSAYVRPGKGLVPWSEAQAEAALSWLTARLTDDDVVEAAAEAMLQRHDWGRPAAAAAVIGSER